MKAKLSAETKIKILSIFSFFCCPWRRSIFWIFIIIRNESRSDLDSYKISSPLKNNTWNVVARASEKSTPTFDVFTFFIRLHDFKRTIFILNISYYKDANDGQSRTEFSAFPIIQSIHAKLCFIQLKDKSVSSARIESFRVFSYRSHCRFAAISKRIRHTILTFIHNLNKDYIYIQVIYKTALYRRMYIAFNIRSRDADAGPARAPFSVSKPHLKRIAITVLARFRFFMYAFIYIVIGPPYVHGSWT